MARFRGGPASALLPLLCGALPLVTVGTSNAQVADGQPDGDVTVGAPADDTYSDTDPSALTDFRPTLDPHGAWNEDPSYGTVWTPNPSEVGTDFQPYDTSGQWSYTDGDYNWESSFDWGWVCFHYGRWAYSQTLGWMWIPGRAYAASWVTWRMGDDGYAYVGWAPLAPTWAWFGGGATAIGAGTPEPWTFTGRSNVLSPAVSTTAVHGAQAAAAYQNTRPYVAASPGVGPNASPQGAWSAFVPATSHGPSPSVLGIDGSVTRRTASAGDLRARQYARPSTAVALGAHGPVSHVVHGVRRAGASRGAEPRGASGRARR